MIYETICNSLQRSEILNFLTVNQRVSGSSPEGGAKLDKPSEMMAFSLYINDLGVLHLF